MTGLPKIPGSSSSLIANELKEWTTLEDNKGKRPEGLKAFLTSPFHEAQTKPVDHVNYSQHDIDSKVKEIFQLFAIGGSNAIVTMDKFKHLNGKHLMWNDLWNMAFAHHGLTIKSHLYSIPEESCCIGRNLFNEYIKQKEGEDRTTYLKYHAKKRISKSCFGKVVPLKVLENTVWYKPEHPFEIDRPIPTPCPPPEKNEVVVIPQNGYRYAYTIDSEGISGASVMRLSSEIGKEYKQSFLSNSSIGRLTCENQKLIFNKNFINLRKSRPDTISRPLDIPSETNLQEAIDFFKGAQLQSSKYKWEKSSRVWNYAWNYFFAKNNLTISSKLFSLEPSKVSKKLPPSVGYYV